MSSVTFEIVSSEETQIESHCDDNLAHSPVQKSEGTETLKISTSQPSKQILNQTLQELYAEWKEL